MGFVDGEQARTAALEQVDEAGHGKAFGCDINQLQPPFHDGALD